MKLSISMLRWYLQDYRPREYIRDDSMQIRGIRFLSAEEADLSSEYVYFGNAGNFFSDVKYRDAYIIVNGKSRLMFFCCDYEQLLNSLLEAFDYFIAWENRLLEASSRHAGIHELVEIAFEVIQNSLAVDDVSACKVFASIDSPKAKYDPLWAACARGESLAQPLSTSTMVDMKGNIIDDFSDKPQILKNFYPDGDPVIMMYIYNESEPVAVLAVRQDDPDLTEMNRQLFPLLGRYFAQAYEFTSADSVLRTSTAILRDLLSGQAVSPEASKRFVQFKLPPPYRLVVLQHESRKDHLWTSGLTNLIQRTLSNSVTLELNSNIVSLVPEQSAGILAKQIGKTHGSEKFMIGISMPILHLEEVPTGYHQAKFALSQLHGKAGVAECEHHAFDYMIGEMRQLPFTSELLHPALRLLMNYDSENQSELRKTLSAYLQCQQNQNETAQMLHVHNNTLKYRLRRIREITGLTLTEERELDYLRLSVWLDQ